MIIKTDTELVYFYDFKSGFTFHNQCNTVEIKLMIIKTDTELVYFYDFKSGFTFHNQCNTVEISSFVSIKKDWFCSSELHAPIVVTKATHD